MIALDTNMLIRALVADDPAQVEVVQRLMATNTVFISRTVLLETEWVLRSRYKKTRVQLQAFLTALIDTDNLIVEAADAVSHAIEWYIQGADFADAMHLSACDSAVMHTFDRDFCKDARQVGVAPEVNVWAV